MGWKLIILNGIKAVLGVRKYFWILQRDSMEMYTWAFIGIRIFLDKGKGTSVLMRAIY